MSDGAWFNDKAARQGGQRVGGEVDSKPAELAWSRVPACGWDEGTAAGGGVECGLVGELVAPLMCQAREGGYCELFEAAAPDACEATRRAVQVLNWAAGQAWRGPEGWRPAGSYSAFDESAWWLCVRAAKRLVAELDHWYRGGEVAR